MLRHKSQQKSVRQSAKRKERNVAAKTAIKTAVKKATASFGTSQAEQNLKTAIKRLDKSQSHGVLHKNTVARKKSRIMKRYNESKQEVAIK